MLLPLPFFMIIKDEKSMVAYGKKLASTLTGGEILCLSGDLGAGKTCLTKGIALGLGIKKEILSPTFTLMNVYPASPVLNQLRRTSIKTLVHIDTYRLKNENELLEIGAEDYLGNPNTICVIEWPEKIAGLLKNICQKQNGLGPKKIISVEIKHLEKGREIFVK